MASLLSRMPPGSGESGFPTRRTSRRLLYTPSALITTFPETPPMPTRLLPCLLLLAAVASAPAAEKKRGLDIHFVDTEGGAATLIVTPAGESVLIDCGNPGKRDAGRIHEACKKIGLKEINHLIITHWHTDHYGGAGELAKLIPIRNFHDRGIPESLAEDKANFPILIRAYKTASGGKSNTLKPGDTIPL